MRRDRDIPEEFAELIEAMRQDTAELKERVEHLEKRLDRLESKHA